MFFRLGPRRFLLRGKRRCGRVFSKAAARGAAKKRGEDEIMGLFGFGKKKQPPLDEGERLYRQALSAGGMRQKLEYLEQSAALGNRHAKAALARCYWENFSNEAEKIQKAAALLRRRRPLARCWTAA